MGIKSIHISNVLSFDDLRLDDIKDINCIIGQNNVGKTNLSKVINYFYSKLKNENILPLELNSRYSPTGKISITYDTTRLKSVLSASKNNSKYQKFAYKSIFKSEIFQEEDMIKRLKKTSKGRYQYILTLTLDRNGAVSWSEKDENAREVISRIYPFYAIDTRRLDLYDWSKIWNSISQLKF
ncbi:TPA: AAA family ATPase, partial [Aeromonas veronii]